MYIHTTYIYIYTITYLSKVGKDKPPKFHPLVPPWSPRWKESSHVASQPAPGGHKGRAGRAVAKNGTWNLGIERFTLW